MQSLLLFALFALSLATTYFSDHFDDSNWKSRWIASTKRSERGVLDLSAGKCFTDEDVESGLRTSQDARFYAYSASFSPFSNEGKDLVFQFSVKHEQNIDCGGGYFKLHPTGLDQNKYDGDSEYFIMFGPDICGSTRRVHFILNNGGTNHLINKNIPCETDTLTHVYTMILHPDNTYQVLVDGAEREKGSLEEDWSILKPKKINDPSVSKPADWQDQKFITDPDDVKPEGYDDIPKEISDPDASKPEDWDDELDGEWEAPKIPNPEYKGEWRPRQIENPKYQGEWVHPQIDNPEYAPNDKLYSYSDIGAVGLEIWQVKSGSIFDNILITDSVETAEGDRAELLTRKAAEQACEDAQRKAKEAEDAAKQPAEPEEPKEDL
jgi:calreticulin